MRGVGQTRAGCRDREEAGRRRVSPTQSTVIPFLLQIAGSSNVNM